MREAGIATRDKVRSQELEINYAKAISKQLKTVTSEELKEAEGLLAWGYGTATEQYVAVSSPAILRAALSIYKHQQNKKTKLHEMANRSFNFGTRVLDTLGGSRQAFGGQWEERYDSKSSNQ